MSPKEQKPKFPPSGRKRPRAWHHGRGEDRKFDRAIQQLDQAWGSNGEPPEQETGNKKEGGQS